MQISRLGIIMRIKMKTQLKNEKLKKKIKINKIKKVYMLL